MTTVRSRSTVRALWVVPFLVGTFFPYLKVTPLETDLQPLALIIGGLITVWYLPGKRLPKPLLTLLVLVAASLGSLALSNLDFNSLRSIANYVSYFVIGVAAFLCADSRLVKGLRVVDVANVIWCVVGMVQVFISKEFLTGALSHMRTTIDRGTVSLAAEPSFYGTICYLFVVIYFLQRREYSWGSLLAIFQIIFLAKSPLGLALFVLFLAIYLALNLNLTRAVAAIATLGGVGYLITVPTEITGSRLQTLVLSAWNNPAALLVSDHSSSARFYHIAYAIKGTVLNGLLPHGYSAWAAYFYGELGGNSRRYLGWYMEAPDRIMSALGAPLFELGLFGLIVPITLVAAVRHYYGTLADRRAVTFLAGVLLAMLNSVPLGFPMYGFLIGYCFGNVTPELEASRQRRRRTYRVVIAEWPAEPGIAQILPPAGALNDSELIPPAAPAELKIEDAQLTQSSQ